MTLHLSLTLSIEALKGALKGALALKTEQINDIITSLKPAAEVNIFTYPLTKNWFTTLFRPYIFFFWDILNNFLTSCLLS